MEDRPSAVGAAYNKGESTIKTKEPTNTQKEDVLPELFAESTQNFVSACFTSSNSARRFRLFVPVPTTHPRLFCSAFRLFVPPSSYHTQDSSTSVRVRTHRKFAAVVLFSFGFSFKARTIAPTTPTLRPRAFIEGTVDTPKMLAPGEDVLIGLDGILVTRDRRQVEMMDLGWNYGKCK